ncbi:MAG: hypothetical protein J0L57_02300 [Burkholderiales bacterium]|nr:hypothetical protein [Burkholderiales bacterium]
MLASTSANTSLTGPQPHPTVAGTARDGSANAYRRMIDCDASPDPGLTLGIATSQRDLEACFALLHDAYVDSGFMKPHPSGLRVTPYHALPTTTTLCARLDGTVVGTLSIIREGVFGFPLQTAFNLAAVRALPGRIAEISALAIHPAHRTGKVLFPLLKFMYEYCIDYFDTRHLVIAVNPKHVGMYESLLLFRRLQEEPIENYDFVDGAPAVGATLDLDRAPSIYRQVYGDLPPRRNLYDYFTRVKLPNIQFPERRYHVTVDPVMSPSLLDHFFSRRTQVFLGLDARRRQLLRSVYPEASYAEVLPKPDDPAALSPVRRYRRYSLRCPGTLRVRSGPDDPTPTPLVVLDASRHGFLARTGTQLSGPQVRGCVRLQLGFGSYATEEVTLVRRFDHGGQPYAGFSISRPSQAWEEFISEIEARDQGVAETSGRTTHCQPP